MVAEATIKRKEPKMETVKTYMIRKPSNIDEVLNKAEEYPPVFEVAEIAETINLTPKQYKAICKRPFDNYDFLTGKGGYEVYDGIEYRQVIALACEGEQTLYVDPSGSSYCRYLGIKIED